MQCFLARSAMLEARAECSCVCLSMCVWVCVCAALALMKSLVVKKSVQSVALREADKQASGQNI